MRNTFIVVSRESAREGEEWFRIQDSKLVTVPQYAKHEGGFKLACSIKISLAAWLSNSGH